MKYVRPAWIPVHSNMEHSWVLHRSDSIRYLISVAPSYAPGISSRQLVQARGVAMGYPEVDHVISEQGPPDCISS